MFLTGTDAKKWSEENISDIILHDNTVYMCTVSGNIILYDLRDKSCCTSFGKISAVSCSHWRMACSKKHLVQVSDSGDVCIRSLSDLNDVRTFKIQTGERVGSHWNNSKHLCVQVRNN